MHCIRAHVQRADELTCEHHGIMQISGAGRNGGNRNPRLLQCCFYARNAYAGGHLLQWVPDVSFRECDSSERNFIVPETRSARRKERGCVPRPAAQSSQTASP